ncbi:MAG: UDP-glucose/GDP-mannose dehydrogenase family protein [Nitrosomonadaceae bacterium]|nr:UDP-glucose/GDP-mannose dehydrogenase family protein [Nitrosomonadaceae bacterium]
MRLTIIGTGYVGLVTGTCFADMGNDVLCLDVNRDKIALLKSGGIPIHEPELDMLVQRNVAAGRLCFSHDYDEAVAYADLLFIAVGTPPDGDGSADLQYVLSAAREIGQRITRPMVVVGKSTVPVGTADKVRCAITEVLALRGVDVSFAVISNPEFLKEGSAIEDFMKPDRIIIGSNDEHATAVMRQLYAPFNRNHDKLIIMDVRSAELTKYAANAMLATRISFMNELANLAETLGADIEFVRRGIGSDPRIGTHFLYAGCGYGGSCFPKDIQALIKTAVQHGHELKVLQAVESANEAQKNILFSKLRSFYANRGGLDGKVIALWGLAFKPNTDDMRKAPSQTLIRQLLNAGALVRAYDPVAKEEALRQMGDWRGLECCNSAREAVEGSHALVIVTEWKEFRSPDFFHLAANLIDGAIFDGRNLYDPAALHGVGLYYDSIGRAAVLPPVY